MKRVLLTLPIIVIAVSFLVLSYGINLPFSGQHDWNSVVYSNIARNHLRYGLGKTKLGMATNVGFFPKDSLRYFTHYPPLMPILIAISFFLFGITEWAGRLVPILSAVLMIYIFFKLVSKYWGTAEAIFTSLFFLFSPMLIYYSKIPVHETVVLGFLSLTFWFYYQWIKNQTNRFFWLTLLSLFLSQLTSWSGFYLSAYLPLHAVIFAKIPLKKNRLKLMGFFILAPLMFVAHNLHMILVAGRQFKSNFIDVFLFRLNIGSEAAKYGFSYPGFLERQSRWMTIYFTRIMVVLSIIWLVSFIYQRIKKQKTTLNESFILLLLVFGFTHNLIFRNLAFIHDYMLIYALPFFAVSAAIILTKAYVLLRAKAPSLAIFAITVVFILFATERLNYLGALFRSGQSNPAVPLAQAINQISDPQDNILFLGPEFRNFYDIFINFYSDRKNETSAKIDLKSLERYDYVVIPKSHDYVSQSDKQYLNKNFSRIEQGGGIIYNLNKPQ